MLQSDDPRFADFDQSPGPVHSRSSGCWITWDRQYGKSGIVAVSNGRIGKSGYVEGYVPPRPDRTPTIAGRSEEHTSELQSLMRISYAVFCLKKKIIQSLINLLK